MRGRNCPVKLADSSSALVLMVSNFEVLKFTPIRDWTRPPHGEYRRWKEKEM
jgi:hypothetical protein